MPLELFKSSESLTMGVELELQLVNLSSFNLAPSSPDLLHVLKQLPFPGSVMPEITESMIEVATSVHSCHRDLLNQLRQIRDTLVSTADRLNIGICGGGTHPFQNWSEQRIFSKPRFQEVSELYGYLAQQFTIFGQHIHIGCRSGDEALFLLHALNRYVPHFIALSASSPFVQGRDTLFNSARLNSVFAFPFSGRAPFILFWDQFVQEYFLKMEHTGIIKSMKDFYWDIRPKPEFGTVELRICDTPLTVDKAADLAAYAQMLACWLLDNKPELTRDIYTTYLHNRFNAARYGMEGVFIDPVLRKQIILGDYILDTCKQLETYADTLGSQAALSRIKASAHQRDNDAKWLRQQYRDFQSLNDTVMRQTNLWCNEISTND